MTSTLISRMVSHFDKAVSRIFPLNAKIYIKKYRKLNNHRVYACSEAMEKYIMGKTKLPSKFFIMSLSIHCKTRGMKR